MTNLTVPLQKDREGVWRIAGSRITLDLVVGEYWQGWTAEEIADAHPTVALPVVYSILAWYLSNREEVDRYLEMRREQARVLEEEVRAMPQGPGIQRLRELARRRDRH